MRIVVLHGPNLNLLGKRQPDLYGRTTLDELNAQLIKLAQEQSIEIEFEQHNGEGALVEAVHAAHEADAILINPAAYTHTSVALRDALLAIAVPTWGVHLTEPKEREPFRQIDLIEDLCIGRTAGSGVASYTEALRELVSWLHMRAKKPHL
jgi:3-dehydroquinate dehydratase II